MSVLGFARIAAGSALKAPCERLSGWAEKKCVPSPRSTGYAIKHLDGWPKLIFANVLPEHLSVPASIEARLKTEGCQMQAWRNNQLLRFNEKWAIEPADEKAGDVHPAVLRVIRATDRARPSMAKRRQPILAAGRHAAPLLQMQHGTRQRKPCPRPSANYQQSARRRCQPIAYAWCDRSIWARAMLFLALVLSFQSGGV